MLEGCVSRSYDLLAQIINILDVVTDLIVCIEFYHKDRMVFFGISVSILSLAHIAYVMAFMIKYSREEYCGILVLFLALLPISPFIPFIMFFADHKNSCLAPFLESCCCFNISLNSEYIPDDASKLRKFMEEKIEAHAGFIIEALVEAFPQAILQMIAIVTYNEANYISIASILLSMLSMASKSFIFSIAFATNMKQLFFNWLCAVTDFFGIFVMVSWVFYQPENDELSDAFHIIQSAWYYKVFCIFPTIIVVSIGILVYNVHR